MYHSHKVPFFMKKGTIEVERFVYEAEFSLPFSELLEKLL